MTSNRSVILWNKKLPQLCAELKALEKERTRINKRIQILEDRIELGSNVDEIYKGVALKHHGFANSMEASWDKDNTRGGSWYLRCDSSGRYGVRTWAESCGRKGEGVSFIPGFASIKEAEAHIKAWIVDGIRPPDTIGYGLK
jgi:hypothetical protein